MSIDIFSGVCVCVRMCGKLTLARSHFAYAVETLATLGVLQGLGNILETVSALRTRFIFRLSSSAMPSKLCSVKWSLQTTEYALGSFQSALILLT